MGMHAYFANENENFLTFFCSSTAITKKLILTFDLITSIRTLYLFLSNNFPDWLFKWFAPLRLHGKLWEDIGFRLAICEFSTSFSASRQMIWIHFLLAPSPKRLNDCARDFPEQATQGMLWMMSLASIFGLRRGSLTPSCCRKLDNRHEAIKSAWHVRRNWFTLLILF